MMVEYSLTIGLFDKDSEKQEISGADAKEMIAKSLIEDYGIFAFTMMDAYGVYRMESSKRIVQEPSIRIEIAMDEKLTRETIDYIIADLKKSLNQESIMLKMGFSEIQFL